MRSVKVGLMLVFICATPGMAAEGLHLSTKIAAITNTLEGGVVAAASRDPKHWPPPRPLPRIPYIPPLPPR